MDLFTQTLNGFSTQLAVSFNPDIFESNVINITILLGGIIYLGSNALSETLSERQQTIMGAIQEAEERLQQADIRLSESEKQLEQAQSVIESIKTDAEITARNVKSGILTDGKTEIERLTATAKAQLSAFEAKMRKKQQNYLARLVLEAVRLKLGELLNTKKQHQLIDLYISKLGD